MHKLILKIKNAKQRGEAVEALFVVNALCHGLRPSAPWGESGRFDYITADKHTLSRVQVKSTYAWDRTGYHCWIASPVSKGRWQGYNQDEIDFIAAYVIPENAWYILPVEVTGKLALSICLNPRNPRSKYHRYLEAWPLLRQRSRTH